MTLASFLKSLDDPEDVQVRFLRDLLRRHRDTDYGRRHGFAEVSGPDEYRARVPLVRWPDLEPWVERVQAGDEDVLTADPVTWFGTTSGTTGRPKSIPLTGPFLEGYREHAGLWGRVLVGHFPLAAGGGFLNLVNIVDAVPRSFTARGVPCGSITGLINRKDEPRVSPEVFRLPDLEAKYYLAWLFALQAPAAVVATINPSTLVLLCRRLNRRAPELIRDLRAGTLEGAPVDGDLRGRLQALLRPRPEVAGRMEDLLDLHGEVRPRDLWPGLEGLACWKGGSVGFFVDQLERWFGPVPVLEMPYMATEGLFSVPLDPRSPGGPLALEQHFFEFLPVAGDAPPEQGPTLLAWEVEAGREYALVISGHNGLYRYCMDDVVRVVGFRGRTPEVAFLRKTGRVLSLTGEKVTEAHVAEAMARAARRTGRAVHGASATVRLEEVPRYLLAVEPDGPLEGEAALAFLHEAHRALREVNEEYELHQGRGALGEPLLALVEPGGYEAWERRAVAEGLDPRVKLPVLFRTEEALRAALPVRAVVGP